jgi:cyclic dehypoxanthinyl futalosine synthase
MTVDHIVSSYRIGTRLTPETAAILYRDAPTSLLGHLADAARLAKHPEGAVTYIIDRNVNYTNVCVARCKFCAFYRTVGSSEGYTLGFDEIYAKIEETMRLGGGSCCCRAATIPTADRVVRRSCSAA